MDITQILPGDCSSAMLEKGREICLADGYVSQPMQALSNGGILLQAKVRDSFNFVDRPQVTLDAARRVVSFRCGCGDYRQDGRFCSHCAAVVLEAAEKLQPATLDMTLSDDAEPEELPAILDFSYRFCNSQSDLYPREREPRIPLQCYLDIFGNTAQTRMRYKNGSPWGGSCFGMSSSAAAFYQPDSGISVQDFDEKAVRPLDLQLADRSDKLGMTLHRYIEYMQILQGCEEINDFRSAALGKIKCLADMVERIEMFQRGECGPVVMSVRQSGGHAILPFRVERISATEERLHIYDPNVPEKTRYADLKKTEDGKYISWRFHMYDDELFSNETNGKITYITHEIVQTTWENRRNPDFRAVIGAKPGVAVAETNGTVLARFTETGVETYREDVKWILMDGSADGESEGMEMITLPVNAYLLRQEDPQQSVLEANIADVNLAVSVKTTAREVILRAEDMEKIALVLIKEPECEYTVEFMNSLGEEYEETVLEGITGQEELCLVQRDSQLYAKGLAGKANLYINDLPASLSRIQALTEEILQIRQPQRQEKTIPQENRQLEA